jgi:hypothetical protein
VTPGGVCSSHLGRLTGDELAELRAATAGTARLLAHARRAAVGELIKILLTGSVRERLRAASIVLTATTTDDESRAVNASLIMSGMGEDGIVDAVSPAEAIRERLARIAANTRSIELADDADGSSTPATPADAATASTATPAATPATKPPVRLALVSSPPMSERPMDDRVVDAASSDELAPVDAAIDAAPLVDDVDTANVVDAVNVVEADDKIVVDAAPLVDVPPTSVPPPTAIIPARPPRRRRPPPPSPTDPTGSLSGGSADASADPPESDRSAENLSSIVEKLSTAPESPPAVDIPPTAPPPAVDIPAVATDQPDQDQLPYGVVPTTRLPGGSAALSRMISRRSLPRG